MLWTLICLALAADPADPMPRSVDDRLEVSLFAEHPQVATPTGIDVDHAGRVWMIESNTHFRPDDYPGHPSDRLLILHDTTGSGQADTVKTFADGFTHAMSVVVRPVWLPPVQVAQPPADEQMTQVYVATRREILLLEDTDGDDEADRRTTLVHLETEGNYPHNGLAGFAFHPLGWLYFGFGENLGEDYTIVGRDKVSLSGGGEGGNIYRVRPDGSELTHGATGFWNPHANCFDAFGRLFSVDNDPDSRPPCRLLHIIEGGDYGYRFRNGRKGTHPFTAWNGEVPGTLPMVAGTGEAPSGILAYEHDAFPEEYLGNLIGTSWGDHRIERFRLQPKGASFESIAEPLVVGGENFRPVGIALAPDGSLYCTDWVLKDYKLHGKGRVWRIAAKEAKQGPPAAASDDLAALRRDLRSSRGVRRRVAAEYLAATEEGRAELIRTLGLRNVTARTQVEALWGLSRLPEGALPERTFTAANATRRDPGDGRRIVPATADVYVAALELMGMPHFPYPQGFGPDGNSFGLLDDRRTQIETGSALPLTPERSRIVMAEMRAKSQRTTIFTDRRFRDAAKSDRFLQTTLVDTLSADDSHFPAIALKGIVLRLLKSAADESKPADDMLPVLVLSARKRLPADQNIVEACLETPSETLRRIAVQWAAEEGHRDLLPQVEAVLRQEPMSADLFLATLAAIDMLKGNDPALFERTPLDDSLVPLFNDDATPPEILIQALRLANLGDRRYTTERLIELSRSKEQDLQLEAVRALAAKGGSEAYQRLVEIVSDRPATATGAEAALVGEAILGLAYALDRRQPGEVAKGTLLEILKPLSKENFDTNTAAAAIRSLRQAASDEEIREAIVRYAHSVKLIFGPGKHAEASEVYQQTALALEATERPRFLRQSPGTNDEWRAVLADDPPADDSLGGPIARGRVVFLHPNGPSCAKCHRVNGRGGAVGPDLSKIGGAMSREKLIESILEPSKEISPQFTTWSMLTVDGQVHAGMIVHENQGTTILGDSEGRTTTLKTIDIEQRVPQSKSVMPEKLAERMTEQEFHDLLAYLQSLK